MQKRKTIQILGLMIFLIFLVMPIVQAGPYGAGPYGAGTYGIGEAAAPSGGTGGAARISGGAPGRITPRPTYECRKDLDCGSNKYCFENKCHVAECFDDSVCKVNQGETCLNYRCVKLFDLKIIDFESPIKLGEFFEFSYLMKGVAQINGDVQVDFWLEKDGKVASSGSDVIYMGSYEEKVEKTKLFLPSTITSGAYEFYVKLTHGTYEVSAHRTVEILVDKKGVATLSLVPEDEGSNFKVYLIAFLIGLGASIIFLVLYLESKNILKSVKYFDRKHRKLYLRSLTNLSDPIYDSITKSKAKLSKIKKIVTRPRERYKVQLDLPSMETGRKEITGLLEKAERRFAEEQEYNKAIMANSKVTKDNFSRRVKDATLEIKSNLKKKPVIDKKQFMRELKKIYNQKIELPKLNKETPIKEKTVAKQDKPLDVKPDRTEVKSKKSKIIDELKDIYK